MGWALDHLSRVLIDAGVANAILLSIVVALVILTRQPARRIVLARTGLAAALLMPPLVALELVPRVRPIDWMLGAAPTPPPASSGAPLADLEWPAGGRLARALTVAHLGGAALGLAWMGLGLWGFRRLLGRSVAPRDATRRAFDELTPDPDIAGARPELRVSRHLRGPVLGGMIRPTIVIPESFEESDADREALRPALLHELAHADRGDVWFAALAGVVQALWFFLPQPWWLRSQLRIDQEFLADRAAAGPPGESTNYARWLVGLSRPRSRSRAASSDREFEPARDNAEPWREGEFHSPLLRRVAMLLHCPFAIENRPPRWYATIAPAVVGSLAVFLSSLRLLAPVDAAAAGLQTPSREPMARSFQIPRLVMAPNPRRDDGGDDDYVLPLTLPPAFHLRAEIQAAPKALSQIRVAGHPLVAETPPTASSTADDEPPADWTAFSIHRDDQGTVLTVDGHPFPIEADAPTEPEWLTITPARDQTTTLRNLVVTW